MILSTQPQPGSLRGRRVLVVEDEYMIAEEIAEELSNVGAQALGPVARVSDALHLIQMAERIDAALLDVNLGHDMIWPVVDLLVARGVPVVLATGYDAGAIPNAYVHLPRCEKPLTGQDLTRALTQVLVPLVSH